MGNTKTNKYPNGYADKVAYWESKYDALVEKGDAGEACVNAYNSRNHFREKQEQWLASQPKVVIPTYNVGIGTVKISGNINELKDLVIDLADAVDASSDLSGYITDTFFAIESDYQTFHGLDGDNWDKVH